MLNGNHEETKLFGGSPILRHPHVKGFSIIRYLDIGNHKCNLRMSLESARIKRSFAGEGLPFCSPQDLRRTLASIGVVF